MNFYAILLCAVLAMVFGFIWYGPLFGKLWMRVVHPTPLDLETRKKMQKAAGPLYLTQFILSAVQIYVLAHVTGPTVLTGLVSALWVWVGFIMPTIAAACMWTNEPRKMAWTRFMIQAGYQLLCSLAFGAVLGAW